METVIVIAVLPSRFARAITIGVAAATSFGTAACAGAGERAASPESGGAPPCPVAPVDVVVSVDQWSDIVSELGGACARVTTVLASSAVDPHDFEPAPSDAAKFEGAQLIVLNGGHYDEWASKLAASTAPEAPVVDALAVAGATNHANPHAWYDPAAVTAVADAVSGRLRELSPGAAGYYAERRTAFAGALRPYDELIDSIKAHASGKTYAATEPVFDDMAAALGLGNRTPRGYQVASANGTEPSPADLDAFLQLLSDRAVDVLVYNVQTEGAVPQQLRSAAEQAGVPVVDITETVPPDTDSFESWQVGQLTALREALGVA
ncbi:metal ABC transporter solute-binding protein, Zn/Mn family [Mycobacterium sp. E740]|uniref:metal ABC transporter solute-binding protein, Zn/Mn family n=1 Tax=Mycobacterium sp. E740 TaxID=1834149 RepID=UPI0007FBB588|nr:ABC transporter substrate-binding protein [Mycobacterium sp. E740]